MILYGFEKRGEVYIPQYDIGSGWTDFTIDRIENTTLYTVAESLGRLSSPFTENGWFNSKEKDKTKQHLAYTKHIYAAAFLGAAKSWYTNINFEMEIDVTIKSKI